MVRANELPINTNASAMQMANEMFGSGVTVHSASYFGDNDSSGIWTNGDSVSPGATPSDRGVIFSTGNAEDYTNRARWNNQANQDTNTSTNTSGANNVAGFNAIAGTSTYDASYIDVDFTPTGDFMTMQFIFASEEYPEYTNSNFQDAVGVWINGTHVPLSVANDATSPETVNDGNNENLYIDNSNSAVNTEMDGLTVTLTLTIPVNNGVVNSIRIGIADTADYNYDSNLLIAGDSLQTAVVALDDNVDMFVGGTKVLDVTANDIGIGTLTITHINGVAVSAGGTVTLATGQVVTLNGDGTITVVTDSDVETNSFTYTVEGPGGETDTGFVTINTIPCFVAGTMVMTPQGERAVETLEQGDLVMTHDDGPQPLRWIGRRTVAAQGNFAPIHFQENALGVGHRAISLSPQHRVLIRDHMADLLFGDAEVLVAAKDLVNDLTIRPQTGGEVEYVHLLFDSHQVIYAEGLPTESFLPGPQVLDQFEQPVLDEICALFPELDPTTGMGYSPAARRMLRAYEAHVLVKQRLVA